MNGQVGVLLAARMGTVVYKVGLDRSGLLMTNRETVVVFPGQGAYDPMALSIAYRKYPQVASIFKEIDDVSADLFSRPITEILFMDRTPDIKDLMAADPWISQLAIYGADIAAYQILADHGLRPGALAGHSLGEIAALVAAHCFSILDGARIVASRVRVLQEQDLAGGRMAVLVTDSGRAQAIIDLIGDPMLAVASENYDQQVVISGPRSALDSALTIARAIYVGAKELNSPFPFHTPLLEPARSAFSDQIRPLQQRPLRASVYSPILHRYYRDEDSLADLLAEHLIRPVRFSAAVRRFYEEGVRNFIESGGAAGLSTIIKKALRGAEDVVTWPSLAMDRTGQLRLDATLTGLRSAGLTTSESSGHSSGPE